jgi:FK506-binding protein 4/5
VHILESVIAVPFEMEGLPTVEAMKSWPALLPGLHWRSLDLPTKTSKKVPAKANLKVHYKAYLVQPTSELVLIDSSFSSEISMIPPEAVPLAFSSGSRSVVPAWDHILTPSDSHTGVFVGDGIEFLAPSAFCYGSAGSPPKVPANSDFFFQIFIVDATVNENSPSEVAERAKIMKDEGNRFYQSADHQAASDAYTRALDEMRFMFPESEADQNKINAIRLVCNLNRAACQLKLQDFAAAKQSCSDALYIDPTNVKALYRRSQAHTATFDFDRAYRDILAAIKQTPTDAALRAEFTKIKEAQEEYEKKTKAALAAFSKGMFK